MSATPEYSALPTLARRTIEDIIREEQLTDYDIIVSAGSAKGENYVGEISRLKIQGNEKCLNLILKVPPNAENLRDNLPINTIYKREYSVYTEMLPVLCRLQDEHNIPLDERFVPARLYAGTHIDKEELMVFGDLAAEGFTMFDRLKYFDLDHLQLAMKSIARFHATSMVLREVNPEVFSKLATYTSNGIDMPIFYNVTTASLEKLITIIESPADKEILKRYGKKINNILDNCVNPELTAPYNVLCHGDCWSNNFLFKYQDGKVVDMRMLDWQMSRLASPITDLAYMLFLVSDRATRKEHFSDLLDLYYLTLGLQIARMGQDVNKLYPEPVFRKQLRDILPFGFVSGIMVIPFIHCDRGESPDLEKVLKEAVKGEDMGMSFSPHVVTRLSELFNDFKEHKFIT